jgi:hypothetical protein
MKYITILFLLSAVNTFGQECSCADQFKFVKSYYEENNPAFQKIKADKQLHDRYTRSAAQIAGKISKEKNTDLCNIYFNEYLKLLKDHHSKIEQHFERKVDLSSPAAADSFKRSDTYRSFKVKAIDTAQVLERLKNKARNGIEGLYISGSDVEIAVLENGKGVYEGIVMKKAGLLDVGHILFTLSRNEDSTFACLYNTGLAGLNFNTAFLDNVRMVEGDLPSLDFYKTGSKPALAPWEFRALDDDTWYLAIRSFFPDVKQQLDSLYREIIPLIAQKQFLVLDIRNNIGGAEENYFDLLPLIYTKPLALDELAVWVSPDNIKAYEQRPNPDQQLIARMKKAPLFSFLHLNENPGKWEMTGTKYPQKVAVLYNKVTASAGEGLICYAIQSDKVITLGENSGGFIGYGDVRTKAIPCSRFILNTTCTKWKDKSKYEFTGVPPMVPLPEGSDWIQAALSRLKESKQ